MIKIVFKKDNIIKKVTALKIKNFMNKYIKS